MSGLVLDSGPLIASFAPDDIHHARCTALLLGWTGKIYIPEPILAESCTFIRNSVRNGPLYESRLLRAITASSNDFEIVNHSPDGHRRAADLVDQLVAAPLGYADASVIVAAEQMGVPNIATIDFKFLGMASSVSRLKPLTWVLQES